MRAIDAILSGEWELSWLDLLLSSGFLAQLIVYVAAVWRLYGVLNTGRTYAEPTQRPLVPAVLPGVPGISFAGPGAVLFLPWK
ncbi:MAG: hypothetical protein H6559_33355 [Lewinellaceae bacterium]|nr:hypothetical protein [Lewinellaceae bacterium]